MRAILIRVQRQTGSLEGDNIGRGMHGLGVDQEAVHVEENGVRKGRAWQWRARHAHSALPRKGVNEPR